MRFLTSFEREKEHVLSQLDQLFEAIQGLHYEGKMSLQKNIRTIQTIVNGLRPILDEHARLDHDVIFPFAVKHIPILEPMVNFLQAERKEFFAQLESFDVLVQKFGAEDSDGMNVLFLEKLREKGTYIVCIIRNHMQAEIEGIYKVLDKRLTLPEKRELYGRMKGMIASDRGPQSWKKARTGSHGVFLRPRRNSTVRKRNEK